MDQGLTATNMPFGSQYKFLIVHRYRGVPSADWYPALARKLEAGGAEVIVPELPGGEKPDAAEWVKRVGQASLGSEEQLVVIAHSLGTRATLLSLLETGVPLKMLMLVAPLSNSIEHGSLNDGTFSDFFESELDLEPIKRLAANIVVVHSQDDSRVEPKNGESLAKELGARFVSTNGHDHFRDARDADFLLKVLEENLGS